MELVIIPNNKNIFLWTIGLQDLSFMLFYIFTALKIDLQFPP